MLVARHFEGYLWKTIALLHDIVEDTDVTVDAIRMSYGSEIADAVDALTKRKGEKYLVEYIPRVAKNDLARAVKIADLLENIHSATFYYPEYGELLDRYQAALKYLDPFEEHSRM